jgi:hypothetical protein
MSNRTSSDAARIRRIAELEEENARLRKAAADLTADLWALHTAIFGPLRENPRCDESRREAL